MGHRTLGAPKIAYTELACREAKYKSAACFTLGANKIAENVVGIAIKAKHPSISPTAASKETTEERTIKIIKKYL